MAVVPNTPRGAAAAVLDRLGNGDAEGATAAFADDALLAYWNGVGDERSERSTARGHAEIARVLARQGAPPEVVTAICVGPDCFVEGRLVTDGGTFVAGMRLDGDGRIARCLEFHCPDVVPTVEPVGHPGGSARTILERYLRHLIAGEFEDASACFSEDCLYSHPPYGTGAKRVEFRGRGELAAGFAEARGVRPVRPTITCCVQDGPECFIEGVAEGVPDGGSFISSVSLDGEGLIRRYVAFYTASRIPR
jgi:SnoaL-like protein